MPSEKQSEQSTIYQLKISLDGAKSPIWRRIQVPGDVSLLKLHFTLQIAMGWTNSHLHEFLIDGRYYGTPIDDEWDTREIQNEKEHQLEQVVPGKGFQFGYLYDFGDSWAHTILVENIMARDEQQHYPTCLDGAHACPPEDVGGIWGYEEFLEVVADAKHPEHDDYLTWVGGSFDSATFDRKQADVELKNIAHSTMVQVYQRYYAGEEEPELELYRAISNWSTTLTLEESSLVEELPLRRDSVSLLIYLRDHRITGTQSTGNLPLKAIREVTANFVHPPALESKIGDRIYKIRSEYEVWPVYFIHSLLEVGGLIEGGPARRLRLTSKADQFLAFEPPIQVWFLLETWWHHTNWLVAVPYTGIGEHLPYLFTLTTLDHLLALPVEKPITFEDFADRLIQATGLMWTAPDMTFARDSLHRTIERMVIDILDDYWAVEREEIDRKIGDHSFKRLHTFTITRLGMSLLKAVAIGQL
jgi:hypothetical protein